MKKIKIKDLFASRRKPKRLSATKLIGKKVTLRKLLLTDAVYFHDTYEELSNTMYLPYNNLKNVDDFAMYLMDYIAKYENGTSVGWAIISNKTNEFVGVMQVFTINELEKRCTLAFYTVKGLKDPYIVEAINLVVEYLLSTKLIRRIEVKIDADDSFTEIALIKAGFVSEGIKRKYAHYGNEYHNIKEYAILDDDVIIKEK